MNSLNIGTSVSRLQNFINERTRPQLRDIAMFLYPKYSVTVNGLAIYDLIHSVILSFIYY